MWIAKKPFKDYKKGDEVKKEDAMRFGSLYCAQSGDAAKQIAVDSDIRTKSEDPEAQTNQTPPANVITDAENHSAASNSVNEPNLEEMSYQDLKTLATSKGLEFAHNISKANLIELIKGK